MFQLWGEMATVRHYGLV